jgi:pyrimidine-nucleoside phosphorylase
MLDMIEIIGKKKKGMALTSEEIGYFVNGFSNDEIPDYQASALLMAICFAGMDERETSDLTQSMMRSGQVLDFSDIGFPVADKHSTGGVGDTTTLILVPLCASIGVKMAKMSGRGLGHTGGTIDKLEAIPGFRVELDPIDVKRQLLEQGAAILSQSGDLAPADQKLYALRDVTGTIESQALIASSVMSKKLASGTGIILLDVKVGSGAFMQTVDEAFSLAASMVDIGLRANKAVAAVITDMGQPLGNMVGNALEVREAIEILMGKHVGSDLYRVTLTLASELALMAGVRKDEDEALALCRNALTSGNALAAFSRILKAQGGDVRVCADVSLLPKAKHRMIASSMNDGYVARMDAQSIGFAAQRLGAGRRLLDDIIDPAVGIEMRVRIGDYVRKGDPLAVLHVNEPQNAIWCKEQVESAIVIEASPPEHRLVYGKVTQKGQIRL